ncbi:MAG: hypothetical protein Q8R24_03535 [Legionellaceae bacterium]|nr:hypothetical protein [Legionellaceae bacterium]
MKQSTERITSDQLHNENCFRYLRALHLPSEGSLNSLTSEFPEFVAVLRQVTIVQKATVKDENYPYGDLFTKFFKATDEHCSKIRDTLMTEEKKDYDKFISSIYNNNNENLIETHNIIKPISQAQMPHDEKKTRDKISSFLAEPRYGTKNKNTPIKEEGGWRRFKSVYFATFTPQYSTNLPNRLHYDYLNERDPIQLRIGTQAQRINDVPRVCPIYELWLEIQKSNVETDTIDHIYFNNLGLDREDREGKQEYRASKTLHELEKNHPNVAVITLPSDKDLMDEHAFEHTTSEISKAQAFADFHSRIKGSDINNPDGTNKKDFYISEKIKKKLFDPNNTEHNPLLLTCLMELNFNQLGALDSNQQQVEELVFNKLLDRSAEKLGLDQKKILSKAEQQAIWFHFIKFEVSNYIIDTLRPKSINFSCKDAIDRGAVSSAYYNLIRSFECNTPMTHDEFDRALHAASTMVKGRGMNSHLDRIWNTVDAYVSNPANAGALNDLDKSWLIEWRDVNCPPKRANELLQRRIPDAEQLLTSTSAKRVIETIRDMNTNNIGNKKLLLSALTLAISQNKVTKELNEDPTNDEKKNRYDKTSKRYLDVTQQLTPSQGFTELKMSMLKFLATCCSAVGMPNKAKEYTTQVAQLHLRSQLKSSAEQHADAANSSDDDIELLPKFDQQPP